MGFDPWNYALKIWKSIGIPTPNVGVPLGVWGSLPSHSLALPGACGMTHGFPFDPQPCNPLPWSRAQGWGCDIGCHGLGTPQSNLNDVSPRHENKKQDVKDDGDNEKK
jgi:hypothetical protein